VFADMLFRSVQQQGRRPDSFRVGPGLPTAAAGTTPRGTAAAPATARVGTAGSVVGAGSVAGGEGLATSEPPLDNVKEFAWRIKRDGGATSFLSFVLFVVLCWLS
jgi:hypothetical protein